MNKPDLQVCTLQEACDYAVYKIVEQGRQCLSGKGGCAYSDGNGNYCAVGWLLDHDNKQLMACGDSVEELCDVYSTGEIPSILKEELVTFCALQDFHDTDNQRADKLEGLSNHIQTTAPQYQQWAEMGEIK